MSTNAVPPPAAAAEILRQTSREGTLRLGPIDVFPHAAASATYDDNVLISSQNPINDLEWALSPGITLALGDVSAAIPSPVTIDRLRTLLYYSLADETSKPRRFLGVDYAPSINFYTEHNEFNNVDHNVQASGGYNFSRLASELDFDFRQAQIKDSGVGELVTIENCTASLRNRYDLSELSSVEVNGDYLRYNYIHPPLQGFQDFRNTDWFNHQLGEKFSGGLGIAIGFLAPTDSPNQIYEQVLMRGIYRLTGKVYLNASVGVEWRQFGTDAPDSLNPVFSISGIYLPRETTSLTLQAYRREEASPYTGYNYAQLGFSVAARQMIFNKVWIGMRAGYDNLDYTSSTSGGGSYRKDSLVYMQATAEYEFNRHFTGTLSYTFYSDNSDVPNYSYDNNLVGLSLGWRY